MNLRDLISSTRQVKTNIWKPEKDFRSRDFGQIIDFDVKGRYNAHFKTLTVTMFIQSKTQHERSISSGLGDSVISTHTAAITFKNIVQHVVDIKEKVEEYNARTTGKPIESVQDIIDKMQEAEPDLVPIEITDDYIIFRTRITFDTECRVKCTCAHFYYTFAYYCAQVGAYIGDAVAPYKSRRKLQGKTKFRNQNGVPGLCKHLQLLISHIMKADNGINGNMEYSNQKIPIPKELQERKSSKATKAIQQYESGEGYIAENRNAYIKMAMRELKNFNSAVRQQKSENHDMPDSNEGYDDGTY